MGEHGSRRFGAYLRHLREDRGLSLDQIEESALAYRVQISKAYLSRCENGITRPNLERLSVLSKIYNADLGLLIERHETEKELEEVPPVDLTGKTFDEIHAAGVQQALHGQLKSAFMTFSAAHDLAILEGGEDAATRRAEARLSLSYVLSQQERYELACEEAGEVTKLKGVPQLTINRALLQLATAHYHLNRLHLATVIVEGLRKREGELPPKDRADIYYLSSLLDQEFGRSREAVRTARLAGSMYRKLRNRPGEARALLNSGIAYLSLGSVEKSIEFLEKSLALSRKYEFRYLQSFTCVQLGKAYRTAGVLGRSRMVLSEGMEIAREGDHKSVLFGSYLQLYYLAQEQSDELSKASLRRSLRKLATRVPADSPESAEFRALEAQGK